MKQSRMPRPARGLLLSLPISPWMLAFADAVDAAAIPGGAGWIGAGLLGSVLGWLLFVHLPGKDKQIKEMVDSRDALVKELTAEFRASLKIVANRCGRRVRVLTTAVDELRRVMQSAGGAVGYEARQEAHRKMLAASMKQQKGGAS